MQDADKEGLVAMTVARKKKTTVEKTKADTLSPLLERLDELKNQRDTIAEQIKEVQDQVVATMTAEGKKSFKGVATNGDTLSATVVQSSRLNIDELKLARRLGKAAWMRVSTRVLDKKKLEAQIAAEKVDPMMVAECSDEVPNSPYIRLTRKNGGVVK